MPRFEIDLLPRLMYVCPMAKDKINFEKALDDLNNIVEDMESDELSLEQSLKHFEKGIALTRQCQTALKEAEQKVQILTEKQGEFTLENFDEGDDE